MSGKPTRLLLSATLSCFLAGCGAGPGDPFDTSRKDGTVDVVDRPTMETMLARYRAFQADLFANLEREFGKRRWYPVDELDFGVCDSSDPKNGQVAYLPIMGFDGTYPAGDWHRVRDLVIKVGKQHGFEHVSTVADSSDHLFFVGHDLKHGGKYDFGMRHNTSIGIETGCLLWGATPHATP